MRGAYPVLEPCLAFQRRLLPGDTSVLVSKEKKSNFHSLLCFYKLFKGTFLLSFLKIKCSFQLSHHCFANSFFARSTQCTPQGRPGPSGSRSLSGLDRAKHWPWSQGQRDPGRKGVGTGEPANHPHRYSTVGTG